MAANRIVILSDLHLGRAHGAARSARALRPVWRDATHLIINGDVAEIHHPGHWSLAARETLQLFDLCDEDGVPLTLLSGNHDPYISDLRHLQLAEGLVFITHGDALHPAVSPWSPAAGRIRRAHEEALACVEPEDRHTLETRLMVTQHASFAEWRDLDRLQREAKRSSLLNMMLRPWSVLQVLHYWRIFPKLAADLLSTHAPKARFAITGHTHRPGWWDIDDRIIINTGSFGFPGRPWAVVISEDTLAAHRIRWREDAYHLDELPIKQWTL